MNRRLKLLLIAGARPNFMKIAPLIRAIRAQTASRSNGAPEVEYRLVHTGQHYDAGMSDIFFQELGIPKPDFNLGVGSGSHAIQTANVMSRFEPVVQAERPDWVVVVGDVNSTMACTIVASKLGVRVAHVEAGLRSFDRSMPEEINRLVTDALADLLLTPSADANENLKREGIHESRIHLVGNVMIDALLANLDRARARPILDDLEVAKKRFAYVTLHRPSNVDNRESLQSIMEQLGKIAAQMAVVFPIHPRTRKMLEQFELLPQSGKTLKLIEPIGYHDSLCLTENARFVLTDSGGLQEESTYFRTPCLTLRPNTERPITITVGSNRLTHVTRLETDLNEILRQGERVGTVPPLWDGGAAGRIIQAIVARSLVESSPC